MVKFLPVMMIFAALVACDEIQVRTIAVYEASFDPGLSGDVESFMISSADNWGLEVFRKDRSQMKTLTQGKEAFFVMLYANDNEGILAISNVGAGEVIQLSLHDFGAIPLGDLKRLDEDVRTGLAEAFGIRFEQDKTEQNVEWEY